MTGITLLAFRVFIVFVILLAVLTCGYYMGYRDAVKEIRDIMVAKRKNSQTQK